jgi:site-specific recombinase XerD
MTTQQTFSVLFIIRGNRANKYGAPLILRITVNGKQRETSIHRRVPIDRWNKSTQRARGSSPELNELNLYIDNIKAKAVQAYSDLKNTEEFITVDMVMNRVLGKAEGGHQGVIELYDKYLEELEGLIGKSCSYTLFRKNRTGRRHLADFLKAKHSCSDIPIAKFTNDHVNGFYLYLKAEKGHCHNTAVRALGFFKKITIRAIRSGWIKIDPFLGFSLGKHKTDPIYLDQDEVNRIIDLKLSIKRLEQVRDLFIFSCYTGLAYADVKDLKVDEIVKTKEDFYWIKTKRKKTRVKSHIPLLPLPFSIIRKYCDFASVEGEYKVFDVSSNQKVNAYLKEIADLAGISKNVTFHVARHTFATTVTLENGIPLETVSKMLGHSSLITTQHYARVLDSKISKDMEVLRASHLRIA